MKTKSIKVFEHKPLYINEVYDGVLFERRHYTALGRLNVLHKNKYFTILHNGVCFKQYVGVIQIEGLIIEILPKIDHSSEDKSLWQNVLIEMLKITKKIKVQKVDNADVKKQSIHLLDIYFEWFLNEVQLLLRQGLIKQYYKETSNVKALKGKLEFSGHIMQNLVHKERFYTTHQIYDKDHLVHQILGQALSIVEQFSKGNYLYSKCKSVQLDFPEVRVIQANATTFSKIPNSRRTAPYETALALARLIILNYAPNVSSGSERMLALLFDMNSLWEQYILARLKEVEHHYGTMKISGQDSKSFWNGIKMRPDIVVSIGKQENDKTFVIDTKWKNSNGNPSTQDLRQMYVYNEYWNSSRSLLLYPLNANEEPNFKSFEALKDKNGHHECGLGKISIFNDDQKTLKVEIGEVILKWFGIEKIV